MIQPCQEYPPGSGNWQTTGGSSGLEIRESHMLEVGDFMQMAGILGRFHEVAEAIKAEQS